MRVSSRTSLQRLPYTPIHAAGDGLHVRAAGLVGVYSNLQ